MPKENNDSFSSNFDPYRSILEPLVGVVVQIYKGGPESKTGKIVDVQSDYVALLVQDDDSDNNSDSNNNYKSNSKKDKNNNGDEDDDYTVIYYRTEHLQSIGENTMSTSMPRFSDEEAEELEIIFKTDTDFLNLVEQFAGEYVQINQGGPESKKGILLEISGNYMALLTEDDGVVFYNIHHIKSICESSDNSNEEDSDEEQQIPEYYKASSFYELFSQMNYKWVSINRGGPQALEGVLIVNGNSGYYTLVNNDEVLRINPYHIKSISCGPKGALQSSSSSNDNDDSNDESQDNKKSSSSKRSSSKRSSSKRSSSKRSSSKRSSSKRSSSKRSSSKRSSSKRSSSKRSSSKKTSGR